MGLVPSGKKPLLEPMLTQIYVAIMTSLDHNELMMQHSTISIGKPLKILQSYI